MAGDPDAQAVLPLVERRFERAARGIAEHIECALGTEQSRDASRVNAIPTAEPLTVAVRCHTEPGPGVCRRCWEPTGDPDRKLCKRCSSPAQPPGDWRPELMLAFDCETTLDYAQALTFGFARLHRLTWHSRSG